MDYESQLLSKVVSTSSAENLISQGVESRHFYDETNKEVWEFLVEHIKKYKASPSFDVVKEKFLEQVTRRETIQATKDIIEIIDNNDPEQNAILNEIFLDRANDLAK